MKKSSKLESTLVGVAGEYFVAAELSVRGLIASITLRNSRGIDVVVSNSDASRTVSIQVKTNTSGKPTWMLNKKSETFFSDNHFYVFVILSALGARPSFHVVPSKVVADYVATSHTEWLAGTKRDGSARKDSSIRKFVDVEKQYEERWDILGFGTSLPG